MAVLYGNDALSILVLWTKKRYSIFWEKFSLISFKVKALKTLKISSDCHIKTCGSLKRRAILKIPSTVFLEEPFLFLLALKWNLYQKAFFNVKTKTNPNFFVKLAERSNDLFLLSLMNHESHFSNTCTLNTW